MVVCDAVYICGSLLHVLNLEYSVPRSSYVCHSSLRDPDFIIPHSSMQTRPCLLSTHSTAQPLDASRYPHLTLPCSLPDTPQYRHSSAASTTIAFSFPPQHHFHHVPPPPASKASGTAGRGGAEPRAFSRRRGTEIKERAASGSEDSAGLWTWRVQGLTLQ